MDVKKNPMLTDLPLVMANGTFKCLHSMSLDQLEKFLSYLVRFTCLKFNQSTFTQPTWWTENVIYLSDFGKGQVPLPYTRNKSVKLRRLIKLCYTSYNCKDLLNLSEKLAALHALSYKFISNVDGTVTIMQVSSQTPIVMIPGSNLDYDLDFVSSRFLPELTIIPVRKSLIASDTKSKSMKTIKNELNDDSIVIEDSSSDDDVEIVCYEKGAFPPTPPKKRTLPSESKPGPACSKLRRVLEPKIIPGRSSNLQCQNLQPHQTTSQPTAVVQRVPNANQESSIVPYNQINLKNNQVKRLQVHIRPLNIRQIPGIVPLPAKQPIPRKSVEKRYLQCRRNRSHRNESFTFEDIDLTIDYDEDDQPEKKALRPHELSQNTFLAGFDMVGKGCKPPETKCDPVVPVKMNKISNLANFSLDLVPLMVEKKILPQRCLLSTEKQEQTNAALMKYMRKDYELSRLTVGASDAAAVAKVTRKCSVKLKKLNSADLRKWRKH